MRKQNTRNVLFLVVGLGIILIFFIQVGFRLLINGTIFINEAISGEKKESTEKKEDNFFGTLDVYDLPYATNSAEIVVSGNTSEFDTVEFYINNVKVGDSNVRGGSFEETIGKLKTGENTIRVIAKTKDGKHTRESERYTIVMKKEPPTLEIMNPADNSTVNKQEITLEGKTDKGVTLSVNNQPVVVDFQGNFKKLFRLKEGDNTLEFRAEDEAGNVEEKSIIVKFQKDE